ncbi:MAG TPA: outer membrane beta-barrel protein [Gemmatimonadales bacterium]|nr:outer membrane beta-barrel protein [Gemmatimonadales bacterium]
MRAIRRFLPILLLMPLGAAPVQAQSWWAVTYAPSIPLSNTKDFADNTSWRGINVEYKKAIKENVTAGLSFGWHVFDDRTDEVLSGFGLDISGDQFRYVNSFPLLANISYFLGKTGGVRPFIGADVGVYIMEHRLDIGLYSLHETNTHFGFGPEAGIAIPVRPNMSMLLTGRYNYALSAGSVDDQQYINFGVGFAWNTGF